MSLISEDAGVWYRLGQPAQLSANNCMRVALDQWPGDEATRSAHLASITFVHRQAIGGMSSALVYLGWVLCVSNDCTAYIVQG